jgi:hypothetical protein
MAQCVITGKYKDKNLSLPFYVVHNVPDTFNLALTVICLSEKFSFVSECQHLITEFICFITVECITLYPVTNVLIPTFF